jgi:uncharacterized protein YcsI (UPF0317 family)
LAWIKTPREGYPYLREKMDNVSERETRPKEIRAAIRNGRWKGSTVKLAPGYVQANLVVLPKAWAFDFLLFCERNPKPCPILDVTEVGSPYPNVLAPGADLRTDIPRYHIYKDGELVEEASDITTYWREDFVAFLLGCRFTMEAALEVVGIPSWNIGEGVAPPNYVSNIQTISAGPFKGPMVVSMRPIPAQYVVLVVEVSKRFPKAHGTPLQIGDPTFIGIRDLMKPDFGDAIALKENEIPLFWACGVTPLVAARMAQPEIMITHAPGHMFIGDWRFESLEVK